MLCKHCRRKNSRKNLFCQFCGHPLNGKKVVDLRSGPAAEPSKTQLDEKNKEQKVPLWEKKKFWPWFLSTGSMFTIFVIGIIIFFLLRQDYVLSLLSLIRNDPRPVLRQAHQAMREIESYHFITDLNTQLRLDNQTTKVTSFLEGDRQIPGNKVRFFSQTKYFEQDEEKKSSNEEIIIINEKSFLRPANLTFWLQFPSRLREKRGEFLWTEKIMQELEKMSEENVKMEKERKGEDLFYHIVLESSMEKFPLAADLQEAVKKTQDILKEDFAKALLKVEFWFSSDDYSLARQKITVKTDKMQMESITLLSQFNEEFDIRAPKDVIDVESDTDKDGLLDVDEIFYIGTDPTKRDTDNDGYSDFDEIAASHDPLVPAPNDDLTPESVNYEGILEWLTLQN